MRMLLGWNIFPCEKLTVKSKISHIAGVLNTHLISADVEMHFMVDHFLLYKRQSESESEGHPMAAYAGTDRRWRCSSYPFSPSTRRWAPIWSFDKKPARIPLCQ